MTRPHPSRLPVPARRQAVVRRLAVGGALAAGALAAFFLFARPAVNAAAAADPRKARVEFRAYEQTIVRPGVLSALNKQAVFPKVGGTILEIAGDGARVEQGQVLMRLDPTPHQEALTREAAGLRRLLAEWEKDKEQALKEIHKTQDDAASYGLRADLERLRLKDLEAGPSATEELNACNDLDNARNLLQARKEEYEVLALLARDGMISKGEARQKSLEVTEQELKVVQAGLAYRKLHLPDPVKLAEQKLKGLEQERLRAQALERAENQARNLERDTARFDLRRKQQEKRVADCKSKIEKTVLTAPNGGIVLLGNTWGWGYGPGREVSEGYEVMTLTDLRRMKALLTVDEGRIARVQLGQQAAVRGPGLGAAVFGGKVSKVAEKGRDEFEVFRAETQGITGTANRQVFEVEVEMEGEALALRPGLRVEVELRIQRLERVAVVPRAAVFHENGAPFVRLDRPAGPERLPVKVLGEDELFCALEGPAESDRVWLVEP